MSAGECGLPVAASSGDDRDTALDVLAELVDWADHMGGWEAPAWERARALVHRSRRGEDNR